MRQWQVYVYVSVSLCHFFLRHWHVCLYLLDSEEEEEEIRDEQGRILHGYLSKEELAAMQEALADESTPKLDTQQILDLKEVTFICKSFVVSVSLLIFWSVSYSLH